MYRHSFANAAQQRLQILGILYLIEASESG